ncbi:MAG: L-histidine N(alpha)-methyltransferase [Vulcanimicrobiaceae bacterium]
MSEQRAIALPEDRFQIVEPAGAILGDRFAHDVAAGLLAPRKRLASKYLYDAIGSALFEAICLLPEYYLTAAETQILREHGWAIVRALGEPADFFELGSGSAGKTGLLIDDAVRAYGSLCYSPVDISAGAMIAGCRALIERFPTLRVRAYAGDYFHVLQSPQLRFDGRVLAMFMGSNIGNYEPLQAEELLAALAARLRSGDGLLLGIDACKERATLEAAYDDPTGVTAAFDKNLLARINRELGGSFDLRNFDHVAEYDEERGCVASFLEARAACRVRIAAIEREVIFEAGERIHTESSYKYSLDQIEALARRAGFLPGERWLDSDKRFSVNLFVRS